MPRHDQMHAQGQWAGDQGEQVQALNHARGRLASWCREKWGFTLIEHWIPFEVDLAHKVLD